MVANRWVDGVEERQSDTAKTARQRGSTGASTALDATYLYLKEIGYLPLLTADEECTLARRVQQGDSQARACMIETNLLQEQVLGQLQDWLAELDERQRLVLEKRFGLQRGEPLTLAQTSAAVGLTRERVRQIQIDALCRLREVLERAGYPQESIFD
ncbi:hypothetical protein CKO15_01400 [Halorhodospira abdelmalekii]|uniref:sigma factor-like helix-turn-helix DNA-binding protein n=1 Tax=Halorhodospira abdelmalekii TaxID=421629 RepID=UPI0019082B5D|nr:sigma factor-like helix-turn-helix DNA-binding protein [Halorhodospira abdelmalekii]MBK1733957.1 hypothetical protein [Halorhodospira abdelmalekii]